MNPRKRWTTNRQGRVIHLIGKIRDVIYEIEDDLAEKTPLKDALNQFDKAIWASVERESDERRQRQFARLAAGGRMS